MSTQRLLRKRDASLIEGDYAFSRRNFDQIAGLLRTQTGIAIGEAKTALVYSRLAKRLRKLGLNDFDAYCAFIETPQGASERHEMIAALTTNVTRFYREPHHFDYLRRDLAPRIANAARSGERVRLWSAACSSGEEPYSIAMTLLDVFPDAAQHDVRILASDIDPNMVMRAREGLYREDAVAPVPAATRDRWMMRERDGAASVWRIKDEARALITFKELNLIGPWPMQGRFDVVFCRNVVIYFEEDTQVLLWNRFKNLLTPEGRLFVGHSERVDVGGFESAGLTVYKLAGAP